MYYDIFILSWLSKADESNHMARIINMINVNESLNSTGFQDTMYLWHWRSIMLQYVSGTIVIISLGNGGIARAFLVGESPIWRAKLRKKMRNI